MIHHPTHTPGTQSESNAATDETTPRVRGASPWLRRSLWVWCLLPLLWVTGCPNTPSPDGAIDAAGESPHQHPDEQTPEQTSETTTEPVVEAKASKGTFTALTYNVHGLPSGITKDDTNARLEAIGPLLTSYGILGLQEVFTDDGYDKLKTPLQFKTHSRYTEKIENRFYGSGLLLLAQYDTVEEKQLLYKECFGTVDNASDCLASKGLQMVRIQLAEGATLDVYNSHLEAGGSDKDRAVALTHVQEILQAMAQWSKDRAILFMGDTNLKEERASDQQALQQWLKEAGLTDSCQAIDCPMKGRIDRIFFRSSAQLKLTVTSWAIPTGFQDKMGTPLSDHDPIAVGFAWENNP